MYQMTFLGQLYRNKRTDIKSGTKYLIHIANLISRECADLHSHSRVSCLVALLPTLSIIVKIENRREFWNKKKISQPDQEHLRYSRN